MSILIPLIRQTLVVQQLHGIFFEESAVRRLHSFSDTSIDVSNLKPTPNEKDLPHDTRRRPLRRFRQRRHFCL
jgi:hypothetical protein